MDAGFDGSAHGSRLKRAPEVLDDLPWAPPDEVRRGACQERVHLGREPEIFEGLLRVSGAEMARRVRHPLRGHLRGEEYSVRHEGGLGRRRGEEVEHLVVGHAEPPVHEERLLLWRLADLRRRIEDPHEVLQLRADDEHERRVGEGPDELLDQRENAAPKREDRSEERVRSEEGDLGILVEAEIHLCKVWTLHRRVKSWRADPRFPTMPPWPKRRPKPRRKPKPRRRPRRRPASPP